MSDEINRPLTNAEIDAALSDPSEHESEQGHQSQELQQPQESPTPQEINYALRQQWYDYQAGPAQNAGGTIFHRQKRMIIFDRWLEAKYPTHTYLTLTKQIIREHIQFLIDKGDKPNTIIASFSTIKALYYFLYEEEGMIPENPCPNKARVRKHDSPVDLMVPLASLLRIRDEANAPGRFKSANHTSNSNTPGRRNILAVLKRYTVFEVFLSTGMTVEEMHRIVADDINWKDREYDRELECESPYTCGSIMLNPEEIGVKKRRFRKVWLNPIAAKLLKVYMYHFGISGKIPVFPWTPGIMYNMMTQLGANVIKEMKPFIKDMDKVHRRTSCKTEVDLSQGDELSVEVIKSIKKQQAREILRDRYAVKTDLKYDIRKKRSLGPHMLRHAYACAMLYRNYRGIRNDVIGLKRLLGHKLASNTVYTYIEHDELIKTNREWKLLMAGTPKSYWQLLYQAEQLPRLEQEWDGKRRRDRKRFPKPRKPRKEQ